MVQKMYGQESARKMVHGSMTLTMAEFSILHCLQTETEITETTVLSSDTFQGVQNLNGKLSVAIFHVTLSVNFKETKCNSNHIKITRPYQNWKPFLI